MQPKNHTSGRTSIETNTSHGIPSEVEAEFEAGLDAHINHVSDHLDKRELEHKAREGKLPKTGV